MRRKEKSFLRELLMNFILLLCIPLITILAIIWQANRIVENQIIDSETKSLSIYMERLEGVMMDMHNICADIYGEEEARMYSHGTTPAMENSLEKKLRTALENRMKTQYYDIFVYFNRNDLVVSGKYARMESADYYTSYYSDEFRDFSGKEAFLNLLNKETSGLSCHVINQGTDNSYICMAYGFRKEKNPSNNYTVVVVLDTDWLTDLLEQQYAGDGSVLLMYGLDNELLFSSNASMVNLYEEVDFWGESRNVWIDEDDYVFQIKSSVLASNYYVYMVSASLFWSNLRWLQVFAYLGLGLCILFSCFFAYRSAVRSYKPLRNIMEVFAVKQGKSIIEFEGSEFGHIRSFLKEQEKIYREKCKLGQEKILRNLLESEYNDLTNKSLENNNVHFLDKYFIVCVLHAEVMNASVDDLCGFLVQNVFEELINVVGNAYFVNLTDKNYAIIVNVQEKKVEELQEALTEGQSFCRQKLELLVTIGMSSCRPGVGSIRKCYKEAQEAMQYRFLVGNGRLIDYANVYNRNAKYRDGEHSKIYMFFLEYIKNKKNDDLGDFMEHLMYIYQINEDVSVEVAQVFKIEVVSALCKIMKLYEYDEEQCHDIATDLRNAQTLSAFEQILTKQVAEIISNKLKSKSRKNIVGEVKTYIEEHYSDSGLSVTSLGELNDVQPAYLSKIFKEHYNISILDYITEIRIAHAKEMLAEKNASVSEVAKCCGFLSSQVFIRNFKRLTGVTPGKYMEFAHCKRS